MKTSVLLLEKRRSATDHQPNWYFFISEHLGVDDLTPKASDHDVAEARARAERETEQIVAGYQAYLAGERCTNVLGPERITDRLDLRFCVPLFGRMAPRWRSEGIDVKNLQHVVQPVRNIIRPADHPNTEFALIKVSYDGKCEIEHRKLGSRILAESMYQLKTGQMVFELLHSK